MKKILIISSALYLAGFHVHSQEVPLTRRSSSFSLAEAQTYALENNLNVENARLDVDAARERVWENAARGLPQVNASVGYNNNLQLMTTLIPAEFFGGEPGTYQPVQFGTQHNATASIIGSQLLFNGPYIVGLQAAAAYKDYTEKNLDKSTDDIKEAIAQSYYSVILAEATRDAFSTNLETMRERLEESRAMFESGFLEETDVDQIQIAVSSLENEYNAAQQMVELSYRFLIHRMGYDMDADIELTDGLQDIIAGLSAELLEQEFRLEDHIDYKILTSQEQLAFLQMKMYRYEYLPSLNLTLNHMQMAMRSDFNFGDFSKDWYPSTVLGVNLNIPIFTSGNRKARIAQARIEYEKARNGKEFAGKALELAVQQARIDFRTSYQKYLNEKNSIELARKVFERTTVKYQNGLASSLELTTTTEQLTAAQTGYTAAMVELLNSKLALDKALGNL